MKHLFTFLFATMLTGFILLIVSMALDLRTGAIVAGLLILSSMLFNVVFNQIKKA